MMTISRLLFFALICAAARMSLAVDQIEITAITRDGDCTTLTWASRPGEFYTVYWTDAMSDTPFWRIAAVNLPSEGGTTTWSDGDCGDMMGMSLPPGSDPSAQPLSPEELAVKRAEAQVRAQTSIEFLTQKLAEAVAKWQSQQTAPDSESTTESLDSGPSAPGPPYSGTNGPAMETSARFYRVARTGVGGTLDGWGFGWGTPPADATNVIAVSAGPRGRAIHNLALRADGKVRAWGDNSHGQCDVPTNLMDVVAIAAGGRHSVALKRDGSVVLWGDDSLGQITNTPANLTNVVDVKAGCWHTLALKTDGTVSAWGDVFNRTNPVPTGLSNVIAIAAGPRHCLALKSDHTVAAWGFDLVFTGYYRTSTNSPYATYLGTNMPANMTNVVWLDQYSPTPATLPAGQTVFGNYLPTNGLSGLSNVTAISAGLHHNQFVLTNGVLVVTGWTNEVGMTVPPELENVSASSAGWHWGLALDAEATLTTWNLLSAPAGMKGVVAASAGAMHGLAIRTNLTAPIIRRQPRDTYAPVNTPTNLTVWATSAGTLFYQWQKDSNNIPEEASTNLVFTNLLDSQDGWYRVGVSNALGESIWSRNAWVETVHRPVVTNQEPELDLRREQDFTVELSVGVSNKGGRPLWFQWYKDGNFLAQPDKPTLFPGANRAVPLSSLADEGAYWVVVTNLAGSTTSAVWNVKISLRGESVGWGNNGYGQWDSARSETNLIALAAGGYHSLGLREDGTVVAWGLGASGQTNVPAGLTNVVAVSAGRWHSLALRENRTVAAWGHNSYGQTSVPASATNIVAIAAAQYHNVALRNNGTVLAWGYNLNGCLNVPGDLTNVMAVAAGTSWGLALVSNGTVRAWGNHNGGPMTVPSGLSNVVQIAAGVNHALALRADGTVTGFGYDSGAGETATTGLDNVLQVAAGGAFSVVLKNDGTILAWGTNGFGQTNVAAGLGDVKAVSTGGFHALALAYSPTLNYLVNPTNDLLLIYNTNSADSIVVKNYYLTNRPGVQGANVLGVSPVPSEVCTNLANYATNLELPVLQWYTNHPTVRPRYLICFMDVPTTVYDPAGAVGVSALLTNAVVLLTHRLPYITYINMGQRYSDSAGATNRVEDALHYIDKLARFGSNYSPGKIFISASAGGNEKDNYVLDDEKRYYPDIHDNIPDWGLPKAGDTVYPAVQALLATGVTSNHIDYIASVASTNVVTRYGTNLASYMSWGHYGWGVNYSLDGWVRFFGSSEWYIMATVESYNGILQSWYPHHGDYGDWFSSEAFLRPNYEATPIGAVCHVAEPNGDGVQNSAKYFGLWSRGRCFSVCAWNSARTHRLLVVGDPMVKR